MGTGEDHHLSSKPHSWLCDLFIISLKNLLLHLILELVDISTIFFLKKFIEKFANHHYDLMTLSIFALVTFIIDISTLMLLIFD